MVLLAKNSPLIAGSTPQEGPMEMSKVRVDRAFYFDKAVLSVGTVTTLPKLFAIEMQAAKKVTILMYPPPAAPPPAGKQSEIEIPPAGSSASGSPATSTAKTKKD